MTGVPQSYAGGWEEVKALRKQGAFEKSDERILGEGEFVEEVLEAAREQMERRTRLRASGVDLEVVAARVSAVLKIEAGQIEKPGKERQRVNARSLFCFWAVRELGGISQSELARRLGLLVPGVGLSVKRGERLAAEKRLRLFGKAADRPGKGRAKIANV